MAEIIANLINRRPDYNIVFFAKSAEENNISAITQLFRLQCLRTCFNESAKPQTAMFKLQDLENQLKNLNIVFNDAFANQDISIEELKKMRAQISDLEKLILDRKVFLKSQDLNN